MTKPLKLGVGKGFEPPSPAAAGGGGGGSALCRACSCRAVGNTLPHKIPLLSYPSWDIQGWESPILAASGDDKPPLKAESRQGSGLLASRRVYEEIFSSTRNSPRIRATGFKRSCRAREPRAGVIAAEKGMLHIINSCLTGSTSVSGSSSGRLCVFWFGYFGGKRFETHSLLFFAQEM